MNVRSTGRTVGRGRAAKMALAAALALGVTLAGGASAGAAQQRSLAVSAYLKPSGGSEIGGLVMGRGPLPAMLRGGTRLPARQAARRGRQLGIIAILVGLKTFHGSETFTYTFALSRNGCRKGAGGLVGRPIRRFAGGSEAHAVVTGRAGVGALRRARSVVLLSSETGDRFLSCGRIDVEYSLDGDDL